MFQVINTSLILYAWMLVVSPFYVGGLQVSIPGLHSQCYSQHGHLNLGLLIRLHERGAWPHLCSTQLYKVQRLSYLEAFVYAIQDVNNRSDLLPNITLGFLVLDTCANRVAAVSRSLYFIPEQQKVLPSTIHQVENCVDGPPDMDIIGIVGPPSSGDAVLVGSLLSGFQIPLISPSATSDELSDKTRYEYFLRMVPPDRYQVQAMIDLLRHYNWTFTSLLYSQGEYGLNAAERFAKEAKLHDMCLAVDRMLISDLTSSDADDIYSLLLQNKNARAVVLFLHSSHQKALFDAAKRARDRDRGETFRFVWVGSDYLVSKDYGEEMNGAFIMYHSFPPVPAFEEYYSRLTPWNNAGNPWMTGYWAKIHDCSWDNSTDQKSCDEYTVYTGWRQHVDTYVAAYIDAVYSYAHALDSLIKLNCPEAFSNASLLSTCIDRPLLLTLLRNQSFGGSSGVVQFDSVGDAVPQFSIRQFMNNRTVKHREVGRWGHQELTTLTMDEDLVDWSVFQAAPEHVPESVCSKPCSPIQQVIPTEVPCCWRCGKCRANEILTNNRTSCLPCPPLTWPDEETHTVCLQVYPDSVHPGDPVGVVLLLTATLGILSTATVMVWYYRHGHEKLIKASSRELSTVIFIGMLLAYLTVLLLVVRPADGSCVVIRAGFHVSVTLIYGPLMVRTLRIYRIFTGGKKGIKQQRLIGSKSQLALTALLLVPQVVLVFITCMIAPPRAELRMPLVQQKLVELFCDFSVGGVLPALSYNMCLLGVCAVLGFLTRRLPDNFSESWYIFISVSTTLVLWVVTVPALLTSLYANQRYVLVGTCLVMNAAMTLSCLFLPKVYAVYFVDEEAMKLRMVEATRVAPEGTGGSDGGGGSHNIPFD